uniref:Transposase IS66 zinc-finger binding domain-containing protein n=1 Tax=Escherichia coli TaxID=562 RepID=A0A5B9SU98_ECOLX|nr:hypothetical protein EC0638J-ColB-ColM_00159 [Escherichia coli]
MLVGRVGDPAVQRPLRQTRLRKPFSESLPRDENACYLGEDVAEQLELMLSAFRVIRTVQEKRACTKCDRIVQVQAPVPSRSIECSIAGPGS